MEREKKSLNTYIGLKRLTSDLENLVKDDVKRFNLSVNEFAVLELLFHKGPKTIHQVKEKILVANSSTTYIIDKLCKNGLVLRKADEDDKRIIYTHITDKGKKLIGQCFPNHAKVINEYFEDLSNHELDTLHKLVKKLTGYEK